MLLRDGLIELFGPREEVLQKLRDAAARRRAADERADLSGQSTEATAEVFREPNSREVSSP